MLTFIKERPPLVVFFLCILTTSISLFGFSFYIRNTDDIPDSDAIYDWNQLLKHMKELDVCLNDDRNVLQSRIPTNLFTKMSTIQTLVNVNVTDFKRYSKIQGIVTLDGWHSTCPKNHPKPASLEIYFDIPKTPGNISSVDICVSLRGPSEYLPIFSKPNCLISSTQKSQTKITLPTGYLNTTRRARYDGQYCLGQMLTKISFYPQLDLIANLLGNNEKNLIYIHLLWTSCILIFVLLVILIYGILQSDNSKFDRYLEKCANLIQHR